MNDGSCNTCDETSSKVMIWKTNNNVKCFACADSNCKVCGKFDESICMECKTSFYIPYSAKHTSGNTCVACATEASQTKVGLYCVSSNECTANCAKCLNHYECSICSTGYFLTCSNTCQPCPGECAQCTETECTTCRSGFYMLDGQCVGCDCDGYTSEAGNFRNNKEIN